MSYRRTTLFVTGFNPSTRARDLAYEFERYGRLVRCDIPAPRNYNARPFAFVEFEDPRDAEDALYEMGGRRFDGYPLEIQWARNAPSAGWRFEGGRPSPPPRRRYSRSPPPRSIRRRSKSPPPRRRSRSRSRSRNRSRERDRHRSRSRSPKNHSPTPPPAPTSTSAREDAPSTSSNPPPATSGQDEDQAVTTEVAEADVVAE